MVKLVTIMVYGEVEKKPEDFEKKHCHRNMHPFNYPIRQTLRVSTIEFTNLYSNRLNNDYNESWNRLIDKLRDAGLTGVAVVVYAAGGLGRKWEHPKAQRMRRRPVSGFPLLRRLNL